MLAETAEIRHKQRAIEGVGTAPIALTKRWSVIDMAAAADSASSHDSNSPERWLPILGYESIYEVSDHGRVRVLDRVVYKRNRSGGPLVRFEYKGKLLTLSRQQRGHLTVCLQVDKSALQCYVHRLVLEAFVGPAPEGAECRHLNGNPANNRLSNLTWGTREENYADRDRLGEHNPPLGTRNANAVLDEGKVRQIRREVASGRTQDDVARMMGIAQTTVSNVVTRKSWGWVK